MVKHKSWNYKKVLNFKLLYLLDIIIKLIFSVNNFQAIIIIRVHLSEYIMYILRRYTGTTQDTDEYETNTSPK